MALPSFTTGRLVLRPRSLADLDAMAAMDADPEVMRYVGGVEDPVRHRAELPDWIDDENDPSGHGGWSVFATDAPDRFLGWIVLYPLAGWEPDVELGWRFVRDAWGRGYATEAAGVVLGHAFAGAGLKRVVAVLDPANQRSRRVCEKLGMVPCGRRHAYGEDCELFVKDRG